MKEIKTCKVEGCEKKQHSKELCSMHYSRFVRHGSEVYESEEKMCTVEGCSKKHYGKGMCKDHYEKMRIYGTLDDLRRKENVYVIFEDYAEIILEDKAGIEKSRAKIDIEDIEKCKPYKWGESKGYVNGWGGLRLHRFIMNCPDEMVVDHIYHNTLDNRKSQLRICTPKDNARNARKRTDNTSGYRGISWAKESSKWRVQIKVNGEKIHIGYYSDIEEALEARRAAVDEHHGEFGWKE